MTPIMTPSHPWGHDMNKLEYLLLVDTSTQVLAFLSKWCLIRKRYKYFSLFFLSKNSTQHCGLALLPWIII